jgi:hypothetical protein
MRKLQEKEKVLRLRKKGYSYSKIQSLVKVSKSTLSLWLRTMPLSHEQIQLLRGKNPKRIERYRETMRLKKEARADQALKKVTEHFGTFSKREIELAGLFLYWGEGTKAAESTVAITNTDPDVLRFFLKWLNGFGIKNTEVKVVLHLYKDMDVEKATKFWVSYLKIPRKCFRKPYIKDSKLSDLSYKSGFGHGTCSVQYYSQELYLYIMSGLRMIRGINK